MNILKAKKVFKYLKKNNFSLDNIPAKIKILLLNDKVRETLNLYLDDENKIYLRENLYFGVVGTIDKIVPTNGGLRFHTTSPKIAILNYKGEKDNNIYYEYISKNVNVLIKDRFWEYRVGDLHIKQATPLAMKLNNEGNSIDFITKAFVIKMEEFIIKRENGDFEDDEDGLLFR